jgi:hypothetical protein
MMAYASRTGTRVNLDALRRAEWRLLVSATGVWRNEGFPYALDNGAWTAHNQKTAWDERKFLDLVLKMGEGADFVVMPHCGASWLYVFRWFVSLQISCDPRAT